MRKYSTSLLLLFAFSLWTVSAHYDIDNEGNHDFECVHHHNHDIKPEEVTLLEDNFTNPDGTRNLATTTYPGFRMTADLTHLTNGTTAFKNYIKNELIPPVLAYFQAALKMKYPLKSNLKWTGATICSLPTHKSLKTTGVPTDFYYIVTAKEDKAGSWAASSYACLTSTVSKRPLIGKTDFNIALLPLPNGDPLVHERNIYLTLHEAIHTLGFSYSLFDNFLDEKGNVRKGHIKTVNSFGKTAVVLDVPPLTEKLRNHFGCQTIQGAVMENDGSVTGSQKSHFERRHFLYETMTSGVLHGRRISEFTLALLEGSGWYAPDYKYAEPYFYGKGQGCTFLSGTCSTSSAKFDEFCTGTARGCSPTGRGGGKCQSDSKSEGCKYYYPNLNYDCENPDAEDNARFPTREVFGRTAGSKCFSGNLTTLKSSSQTSFCFTYTCEGTGTKTVVKVKVGSTTATCSKEGKISVSGLNGKLDCPDPLTFCNTVGKKYCPRNCMGRGTCTNNKCVCRSGFTGVDCSQNAAISY